MKGFGNLLEGYQRFRENRFETARDRWEELAEGQSPRAVVIACSDSRADPATIFDTNPGEIFVVRNVANLVPPFETGGGRHGVSAALEFAVTQLNVPEIVVMGHERCGGITAALTGMFHGAKAGEGGFVHKWMSQIEGPAEEIAHEHGTGEDAQRILEEVSIRQSLANLRTFPFVAEREKNGTLKLLGCHFSIRDGELWLLDEVEDSFRPV
ncbi:carbonic anhydrase [Sphingomonas sp. NSE70-1]|uniref:Carbonic anhydrase n=1 Tax=Sphingomonas caseinilyticus TaxID=2908205 RepID=A0ABT0RRQ7_9SPHN|nr:carbonic anhydrase [Sphingomonas caseinilyticus]MCL6697508.1 carbonic anhydrase [Sphingomonas caseinilyticus]